MNIQLPEIALTIAIIQSGEKQNPSSSDELIANLLSMKETTHELQSMSKFIIHLLLQNNTSVFPFAKAKNDNRNFFFKVRLTFLIFYYLIFTLFLRRIM